MLLVRWQEGYLLIKTLVPTIPPKITFWTVLTRSEVMVSKWCCWYLSVTVSVSVMWRCKVQWRERTQGEVGCKAEGAGKNWGGKETWSRKGLMLFLYFVIFAIAVYQCLVFFILLCDIYAAACLLGLIKKKWWSSFPGGGGFKKIYMWRVSYW